MSDLIRRDKAIDYFVTNIGIVDAGGYAVDDYDERVKIWTERFSGIPSAEPEWKKGKWIDTTWKHTYKCSECGNFLEFHGVNAGRGDANFCPNCGADMRGDR